MLLCIGTQVVYLQNYIFNYSVFRLDHTNVVNGSIKIDRNDIDQLNAYEFDYM